MGENDRSPGRIHAAQPNGFDDVPSHDVRDDALIRGMDAFHARASTAQFELLRLIAEADGCEVWRGWGARDMAHWVSIRYGISHWKASRWIGAAHALEGLPFLAEALSRGDLSLDKVVELCRFATPETEERLIRWATGVSVGAIRHKADLARRPEIDEVRDAERDRAVSWSYIDEGRRFGLNAELPADQGAVVERALDRLVGELPLMPGEEDPYFMPARRADALVALASVQLGQAADPDRATVVVHANLDALVTGDAHCELEDGPVIHPETVRRLACTARIQTVVEDKGGDPIRVGRITREPPAWMVRQLRWRDRECRFPGCGTRRFTQAHHIRWWEHGGRTEPANLLLICFFHHRLVHEHGWRVVRDADGTVDWFRPDGTRYRAGLAPPVQGKEPRAEREEPRPAFAAVGALSRQTSLRGTTISSYSASVR